MTLLGVKIKTRVDKKLTSDLLDHIKSFLSDLIMMISIYVFSKTFFRMILPQEGEILDFFSFILENLDTHLYIILFVPFYVFIFRAISTIIEGIYEKKREISPTKVLLSLTKATIAIVIVFDVFVRFEIFDTIEHLFLTNPFDDIIKLSIVASFVQWISTLVLNPFFEEETIQINSNVGRVKNIGFFFTTLGTIRGENVYIPNAKLIAMTTKRLSLRESKDKINKERGIEADFSCILNYDYHIGYIESKFKRLFKYENKKLLKIYFEIIGWEIPENDLDYIFSSKSCPAVSVEDFRDEGVLYRFHFRVRDAFYAPLLRSFFMRKFKEEMDIAGDRIS